MEEARDSKAFSLMPPVGPMVSGTTGGARQSRRLGSRLTEAQDPRLLLGAPGKPHRLQSRVVRARRACRS